MVRTPVQTNHMCDCPNHLHIDVVGTAVIHMKMCTPMLAGVPPSLFPGNQPINNESLVSKWNTNMKYYAKYLMDLCVPWTDKSLPFCERTHEGFCSLVNMWNSKSATFIQCQHVCYLSNLMSKGHQNSHN